MQRCEIAWNYITGWLVLDLIASFPYMWVINGCIGESCSAVFYYCV